MQLLLIFASYNKFKCCPFYFSNNSYVIITCPDLNCYILFYEWIVGCSTFFFESRNNKNDPVLIWLTGGPGCGSEVALFYENGPFRFGNNLSLVWNDYGWDQVAINSLFYNAYYIASHHTKRHLIRPNSILFSYWHQ